MKGSRTRASATGTPPPTGPRCRTVFGASTPTSRWPIRPGPFTMTARSGRGHSGMSPKPSGGTERRASCSKPSSRSCRGCWWPTPPTVSSRRLRRSRAPKPQTRYAPRSRHTASPRSGRVHRTPAAFRDAYLRAGGADALGEAAGPVEGVPGGCVQQFVGAAGTAAIASRGCSGAATFVHAPLWPFVRGRSSELGFPTADTTTVSRGVAQAFDHGSAGGALLTRATRAGIIPGRTSFAVRTVSGCVRDLYQRLGGPGGVTGFPIDDAASTGPLRHQMFEAGALACPTG